MALGLLAIASIMSCLWLLGLTLVLRRRYAAQDKGGADYLPTWYLLATGVLAVVLLLLALHRRASRERVGEEDTDLLIRDAKLQQSAAEPDEAPTLPDSA